MNPRALLSLFALATLVAAPGMAGAQPYPNNGNNGYYNGGSRQLTGTIVSVQGSSLTLDNGRTVFLHQGTVINPSGTRLAAGMQISVTGTSNDPNSINADRVDIGRNGYNGYNRGNGYNGGNAYNSGNGYGAGNARSVTGTIVSVQGSSLTLDGGRTVFLHRGTIINPQGAHLRAGMQVNVIGVRSGRHTFNANEIDVTRRHRQM